MNLDSASIVKEIKIMRHLKHSGILKIYEVFEDKEFICLVLELM
jgi:cell cycle serine/threonine-protein kinase CDC5/MSD2/calcium/calmodulin-dependent protein kinase I